MNKIFAWIVAGLVGAFLLFLIVYFVFFPQHTPRRETLQTRIMAFQEPTRPLTSVTGREQNGPGNAAGDYKLAIQAVKSNPDALEEIYRRSPDMIRGDYRFSEEQVGLLEKIAGHVADGAAKESMEYYFVLTEKEIPRPYYPMIVEDFNEVYSACDILVRHYIVSAGEPAYPKAEKVCFDLMGMGQHMIDERARLNIVSRGIGVQEGACMLLQRLYDRWSKPRRRQVAKDYEVGLLPMKKTYNDLEGIVRGLPAPWNCPHPGDTPHLALHHPDRAIRVDATIALGIVKHGAIGRGDQRHVAAVIEKKLDSEDPIEREAAETARDMTAEDMRKMWQEFNELFE